MKLTVNFFLLGMLSLLGIYPAFPQINRNGMVGLVDLCYNQLFVNIAKGSFVSDNEKYFPCLFTIEFPNSINDYWFDLGRESEFMFKFENNQYVFIYDDVKSKIQPVESPLHSFLEKEVYEVNKDSADGLISTWQNHSSDRNTIMKTIGFETIANSTNGHFYVATCSNVLFVFYNITNLDIQRIINSFIVIRPHMVQIAPLD